MTDWLYVEDDESNPVIKIVAIIIGLVILMLAFMYSYTQQGVAYDIINRLMERLSNDNNVYTNSVKYVDTAAFQFKNSTPKFNVPIINLDKPNMFSKFNYTLIFISNTPISGKLEKLNITFMHNDEKILTLEYKPSSDEFPEQVVFKGIKLPITSLNYNVDVYINLFGSFVFMNDKKFDSFVFNPLLKFGNTESSENAGIIAPITVSKIDYSREKVQVIKPAGIKLQNEGEIVIKYPLIKQYESGLPSKVVQDLENILESYYVSSDTLVTIRNIIENTLNGDYTVYGYIGADWIFNSAVYDADENSFTFKFVPIYKIDLEIPYAVLTLYYKIQEVTTDSGTINNYFMITGYDNNVEYITLTGYDSDSLENLFKSIGITLDIVSSGGYVQDIDLGTLDIVTREAVLIHDSANVYLYYKDNKIKIQLNRHFKVKGVDFYLTIRESSNSPQPYIVPKVYYFANSIEVSESNLPTVRLSDVVYYPSKDSVVKRHIDILYYDSVEVGNYFIPYKLLTDENVCEVVSKDLVKSPYIPDSLYDVVKNKVQETLSNVKDSDYLTDSIINSELALEPVVGKIGFKPVINFQVRFYGVTLVAKLKSLIIQDDTGNILYAEAMGLDISVDKRTSITTSIKYNAKWTDFKSVTIELITSSDSTQLIMKKVNDVSDRANSVSVMGFKYEVIHNSDSVVFNYPLPYSSLPKVRISNVRLLESYKIRPVIVDANGNVIYEGSEVEITNRRYYPSDITVNLYPEVYKYDGDVIEIYTVDNKYPLQFKIDATGYYIQNADGKIIDYDDNGVESKDNILIIKESASLIFKNNIENNNHIVVYIIGSKNGEVYYEELKIQKVINANTNYYMTLTNLASDKNPGSIEVMTDYDAQLIEGYYEARFFIGDDVDVDSIKVTITAKIGESEKTVFECSINSCEYKLGSDYWVFKNSKYTYLDSRIGFDTSNGAVVMNILPITSVIDDTTVEKYIIKLTFKDSESSEHSTEFIIVPTPRKINVGITTTDLRYMTVSPILIQYSVNYNDLFTSAMIDSYDVLKMILDSIKVSVVKELEYSDCVQSIMDFLQNEKSINEIMNSNLFKVKEIDGSLYVYPNLNYDGATTPINVNSPREGTVLLFLPMFASYEISVTGIRVTNYELTIVPVRNTMDFKFYKLDEGTDLIAGQEVTLHFIINIYDVTSEFTDKIMNDIKNMGTDWVKVYLVSQSNSYYECSVEEVTLKKEVAWIATVKVKLPDDVPQGTYAFNMIQVKINGLYSPLKTFDELYKENNLNKVFIMSGMDYSVDLVVPAKSISGTLLYAVNSNEFYELTDPVNVGDMFLFIPARGTFIKYEIPFSNRVYLVYPHDGMSILIPVLVGFDGRIDELSNYIQNAYLVSVNLPEFENYTPENYVKSISISFKKGDVSITTDFDLSSISKNEAKNLFVRVVKGDKVFYYFPISITPYYMTYLPQTGSLQVKIEMINGATIERNIKLIPVIVSAKQYLDKVYVDSVCSVYYVKKPSWSGFVISQVMVTQLNSENLIVSNSGTCDGEYYNAEVPIEKLIENKIDLSDVDITGLKTLISLWDSAIKTEKVSVPTLYSLAGALIVRLSNSPGSYDNILIYMKTDNNIKINTIISVSPPDYEEVKQWVKEYGFTITFDGVTFKMIGTKYGSDQLLIIYAKSKDKEAFYMLNITSLTSVGGAQITFNGKIYYIVAEGVSYTLGVLRGVRIGTI